LIDPAKLRTLAERGANPRVQKAVFWLAAAKLDNTDPAGVAEEAARLAGYTGNAASMTVDALTRNLSIAERLGCLDNAGLEEMRRGHSPTIKSGPYRGDELSVDHIIPRSVCYELDNVIANLELMPLRMNMAKSNKVGERQRDVAAKLFKAGLLSARGYETVVR